MVKNTYLKEGTIMKIKSLGLKVSLIVAVMITALVTTTYFIVSTQSYDLVMGIASDEALTANNSFVKQIERLQADAATTARIISYSYEVINAIIEGNDDALKTALIHYGEDIDTVMVCNIDGDVVMRMHNDTKGDNVMGQAIVSNTLKYETSISTIAKGSTVGLATRGSAIIKDFDGNIIGIVIAGHDLSKPDYVDEIKELSGSEVTIFDGDTRLMTTIINDTGDRVIGTQASDSVVQTVINERQDLALRIELFGSNYYAHYTPIIIDGAVMGMLFNGTPIDDKLADLNSLTNTVLLIGILCGLACILIVFVFNIFTVSRPLKKIGAIANKISTGDIGVSTATEVKTGIRSHDEVGMLARALEQAYIQLQGYVREIRERMSNLSDGDLTKESVYEFQGDFVLIKDSINDITRNLNQTLAEINSSSSQVSTGAKQVADGAQALAQGSTEQAASVQQLSSSITEIADRTKTNAETAGRTSKLSATIKESAEKGSRQMDEMIVAVKEINEASQSISKIIKTIDDIAFQTNILALNAAVEAARAGQHGKGFAVVAEEVRNLASKSAEAAKDTGDMIQNSMEKAELGSRIASETAESLNEIVVGINESTQLITEIAESSEEQSLGISQINVGIDQVAQVVQQNSATAEQSAAASEQMSGQSTVLQQLIAQFKLQDSGSALGLPPPKY
jgi:methyl-accepting chemotaxis protein